MRRIFTFSFIAIALSLISGRSFGQTANCSTPTTSGTASDYNLVDASVTNVAAGTTVTYNSPISTYSFTTPPLAIPFYLRLQKTETNGGNSNWRATVTIKWGLNGVNSFSCVQSSAVANSPAETPSSTIYYFTIDPNTDLPQGTNFQISISFQNTGNRNMAITGYAIDKNAQTPSGAALPVKFQALDARMNNSAVSLKWNVATEENLAGYEIEKGTDGKNYSKIGFVAASGQTAYSFVDSKPASVTYYRIKSVDVNGRYAYSTVALVKSGKSMIVLKAFPSPVTNSLTVQHGTASAGSLITINSEDGRAIRSIVPAVGTQETKIDLSAAKTGMYLVRYASGDGEVETLKILKQR